MKRRYKLGELANLIGYSHMQVFRWAREGKIPSARTARGLPLKPRSKGGHYYIWSCPALSMWIQGKIAAKRLRVSRVGPIYRRGARDGHQWLNGARMVRWSKKLIRKQMRVQPLHTMTAEEIASLAMELQPLAELYQFLCDTFLDPGPAPEGPDSIEQLIERGVAETDRRVESLRAMAERLTKR